jgi:peroxin-3
MLDSVTNYLYERRTGFVRSAGVAGGLYLVGQYASARVADMRDGVLEQRVTREKYVQLAQTSPSSFPVNSAQHAQAIPAEYARHLVHGHDLHALA